MKLRDWLRNPIGKGAVYFNKEAREKYDKVYNDLNKFFSYRTYLYKNELYIHVKVPSEMDQRIMYDVLIKPIKDNGGDNILDMEFKVFSNCPSFIYTYAHAYNQKGMVLTEIQKRATKEAITKSAKIRNPYKVTAFEYSIYLAFKFLRIKKLIRYEALAYRTDKYTKVSQLEMNLQDFDRLMEKYNQIKNIKSKRKKREKQKAARDKNKQMRDQVAKDKVTDKSISRPGKQTKQTRNSRTSKTSKRSKRI